MFWTLRNPWYKPMFVGFEPLITHRAEVEAKRQKAIEKASRKAARHVDPGRPVSIHLLGHRIPELVHIELATPTWATGEPHDRRQLFDRVHKIAQSLVLRRWTAEEFCDVMPTYELPPWKTLYCRDEWIIRPRDNEMWDEITHRGSRELAPHQYERMVAKAFKYAEEDITRGTLPDADHKVYIDAVIELWTTAIARDTVQLSAVEAGVLDYVMTSMRVRQYTDVTCPARQVGAAIGINHMTAWRAMGKLDRAGVLVCRSPGNAAKDEAAVYVLSPRVPDKRRRSKTLPGTDGHHMTAVSAGQPPFPRSVT